MVLYNGTRWKKSSDHNLFMIFTITVRSQISRVRKSDKQKQNLKFPWLVSLHKKRDR